MELNSENNSENQVEKNFENLNLSENLLKGVYIYGFKKPSKIQVKGIEANIISALGLSSTGNAVNPGYYPITVFHLPAETIEERAGINLLAKKGSILDTIRLLGIFARFFFGFPKSAATLDKLTFAKHWCKVNQLKSGVKD